MPPAPPAQPPSAPSSQPDESSDAEIPVTPAGGSTEPPAQKQPEAAPAPERHEAAPAPADASRTPVAAKPGETERKSEAAPAGEAASKEAAPPPARGPKDPATFGNVEADSPSALPIRIRGYAQVEYESHQDSEDQLYPDGQLLNQNRFLLRRARLTTERAWDYTSLLLQLDGNTANGIAFRMFRAEATVYTNKPTRDVPSMAALTMGIFRTPFGYELTQSGDGRIFMERTVGSNALFPNETDLGARLEGGLSFFRYAVAVVNGQPPGTAYGLQDPNAHKDLSARFGANGHVTDEVRAAGGVSFYRGKGFHGETPAPKPVVAWRDFNNNGTVDSGEIVGTNATVPPSKSFARWMVGADLELTIKTPIGDTFAYGEVFVANNMDRGMFIADPTQVGGQDFREFGWYGAIVQEIGQHAMVGFRAALYDPNSDVLETRKAKLLPATQTMTVLSPMVAAVLPGRARLSFQYDFINDYLARNALGVPTDYRNDTWTLRLQVQL